MTLCGELRLPVFFEIQKIKNLKIYCFSLENKDNNEVVFLGRKFYGERIISIKNIFHKQQLFDAIDQGNP